MDNFIQEFEMLGLFGYKDICLPFKNSTLIIIGENGVGKTAILYALNCLLTSSYEKLLSIKFDSIRIRIDDEDFKVERGTLAKYVSYLSKQQENKDNFIDLIIQNIPQPILNRMIDLLNKGQKDDLLGMIIKDEFLRIFPENLIYQELFSWNALNQSFESIRRLESVIKSQGLNVLYLATYASEERDFKHLQGLENTISFEQMKDERFTSTTERDIRFGMEGVIIKIDKITEIIRKSLMEGFANVSGEVLLRLMDPTSLIKRKLDCTYDELSRMLDMVGNRLKTKDKNNILKGFKEHEGTPLDNNRLIFYLDALLRINKNLERYESAVLRFRDVCNKYLNDKQFVYDSSKLTLQIFRKVNGEILKDPKYEVSLEELSSGEKQIVSIFSHIYLEVDNSYVVLIDEPELSLSIFWQENLIPDILKSRNCKLLCAMTHSPFIIGEELKQYVIGMEEFIKVNEDEFKTTSCIAKTKDDHGKRRLLKDNAL